MPLVRRLVVAGFLLAGTLAWGYVLTTSSGLMIVCAAVFALGDLLGALALIRRWYWGRWLGLAIGMVGLLNMAVWIWLEQLTADPFLVVQAIAFPAIFVLLLGERMRREFELRASPRNHWDFSRPGMRLLGWVVVLDLCTAPMVLMYGCAPETALGSLGRAIAIACATLLGIGVVLVITSRVAGVFVITIAGLVTVALGIHALPLVLAPATHAPNEVFVTMMTVTAFVPGIVAAVAAVACVARPVMTFLMA